MPKIERGFAGERVLVLVQPLVALMADDPLSNDLYIQSLGHIVHAQYHYVERQKGEPETLFLYCTSGEGLIQTGREQVVLRANQCVVLPAHTPCSYSASLHAPWSLYWVKFRGTKAEQYAHRMGEPRTILPSVELRIEQRLELFETIYAALNNHPTIERMAYASGCFAHFLASFLYVATTPIEEVSSKMNRAESVVNLATHFMNEHVEKQLTVQQIADFTGYSCSYFYRKFIAQTGYAPIDYFIRLKINKASILLLRSSMSVAQIAHKLGFSSPDYFSRTFARIVGISASEFRKQNFRL